MSNETPSLSSPSEDDAVRNALLAGAAVIAAFVAGLLLAFVGIGIMTLLGYESQSMATNVVGTVLQFVGFILAMVVFLELREDWELVSAGLPSLMDLLWGVAGFVGLFALLFVVSLLLQVLGLDSATNAVVEMGQNNPTYFLYMIPITILLVGPGEELVFRGVVQGLFRRSFGPIPAIAVASVLFGAVHVVALIGSGSSILVYVAVAAVLGVILGTLYEVTGNLVIPALVHGLFNATQFTVQYAVASGAVPEQAALFLFL